MAEAEPDAVPEQKVGDQSHVAQRGMLVKIDDLIGSRPATTGKSPKSATSRGFATLNSRLKRTEAAKKQAYIETLRVKTEALVKS